MYITPTNLFFYNKDYHRFFSNCDYCLTIITISRLTLQNTCGFGKIVCFVKVIIQAYGFYVVKLSELLLIAHIFMTIETADHICNFLYDIIYSIGYG